MLPDCLLRASGETYAEELPPCATGLRALMPASIGRRSFDVLFFFVVPFLPDVFETLPEPPLCPVARIPVLLIVRPKILSLRGVLKSSRSLLASLASLPSAVPLCT